MIVGVSTHLLVGTADGLWTLAGDQVFPHEIFSGKSLTALAVHDRRAWALEDGHTLWEQRAGAWAPRAPIDGPAATCLAPTPDGLLIGTEQAHLLRLTERGPTPLESFDVVEGRDAWYTPWGDPADVRSIAVASDSTIHVNVHVGGVVRSRDAGRSFVPTVDIESDVHQVLVHPTRSALVLAASAVGLGVSRDGGDTWKFVTDGLHAEYLRAVAVAGDTVLVSVSTGPGGRRSALYRRPLDGAAAFERCRDGLPTWLGDNVDTGCLAAMGPVAVFGTADGRLFRSLDAGLHWGVVAKGLPPVTCVIQL
jgi:photosystem II stability/assembly factor-like uncharacterized protein